MRVCPLTTAIGALIDGVDLRGPLDEPTVGRLQQALADHLVLFFRHQDITPQQQVALAGHFGPISVAPFGPKVPDHPQVTMLDQVSPRGEGADSWHTDNTFMPEPPLGSILRAVQLPSVGGDTCFASMYAAYDALSPPMRTMLEPLRAIHDLSRMLSQALANGQATESLEEMRRQWPPMSHPVIRTNPDSGRRALFVNGNWTLRIEGINQRENDVILPFLLEHVRSPEFQCRFRWEPNSIAFWDNRWVQHYAVADYTERRVMHRVTIAGDRPV
jgi:taurine dioxygenase